MKISFSPKTIQGNIILYVGISISLIIGIIIFYNSYQERKRLINFSEKETEYIAENNSSIIVKYFNKALDISKLSSNIVRNYESINIENRRNFYGNFLKYILEKNDFFYCAWSMWEDDIFFNDSTIRTKEHLKSIVFYKTGSFIKELDVTQEDFENSFYTEAKNSKKVTITKPYSYTFDENFEDIWLITIAIPIIIKNKVVGVTGIDINLQIFQNYIEKIKAFEDNRVFIMDSEGTFIAHTFEKLVGKNIFEIDKDYAKKNQLEKHLKLNRNFSIRSKNIILNKSFYTCFSPINFDVKSSYHWYLAVATPSENIIKKANNTFWISIIIAFVGILILIIIIYFITKKYTNPLKNITEILIDISKGKIVVDKFKSINSNFDISVSKILKALESLTYGVKNRTEFANEIAKGNLNAELNLMGKDDILGLSLLKMQKNLVTAQKNIDKQKEKEKQENWIAKGTSQLATTIRKHSDDLSDMANYFLRDLVDYLKINQAGFFVYRDKDKKDIYLKLVATYAFSRKKYLSKRIELGEGLIGTCALEKKVIYITELPDDYINISSGLGNSNPKALLIFPLITENKVLGILELASFKEINESSKLLLERINNNLASTISSIKMNRQTEDLLKQSQKQASQIVLQEEATREQLIELKKEQEIIKSEKLILNNQIKSILDVTVVYELDTNAHLIYCSEQFIKLMKTNFIYIKNRSIEKYIIKDDFSSFKDVWKNVLKGKETKKKITYIKQTKENIELETFFIPIKDEKQKIKKVFCLINY